MTDVEIGLAFQEAREALTKIRKTKETIIRELAVKLENAGMPVKIIATEIIKGLEGYDVSKGYVRQCLDEKYKKFLNKVTDDLVDHAQKIYANDDKKPIEETTKPVIMTTTGEPISQDDPRTEQAITDEVKKSMYHDSTRPEESMNPYESAMEQQIKNYNQVMMDQAEKIKELHSTIYERDNEYDKIIDEYKAKLKAAEETTKDAEYIKLEEKLLRLEEINERLLNENKQYSEAVLKRSFESANNVKVDPQQINELQDRIRTEQKHADETDKALTDLRVKVNTYIEKQKGYENYIEKLEDHIKAKDLLITELTQKVESYSHIDKIAEPQPLELDVKPFIGVIFANRGNRVTLVHDGKKVLKITGGDT